MPTKRLTALFVFLVTIAFYVNTLLPSLAWGDGTKLQSEVISGETFILAEMTTDEFSPDPFVFSKVGVAAWDHPLYVIIGHTLVRAFPFVDALWLVNLLSALFGAAAVALVFQLSYQFTGSPLASLYGCFSLAVSHTFWWHSSTPEVYTLFVFLLLFSFHLFDHFERSGNYSSLVGSAFFLGLAASNHLLAFLTIPALALYYLLIKPFRRLDLHEISDLAYPSLGFLVGFSPYLLQFARMARNFPLNEIIGPVVGATFLSQLGMLTPALLGKSLLNYFFFLTLQFSPIGVIVGIAGIRRVFRSRDLHLRKTAAFLGVFTIFGILYQVSDQFAFFMTSYVFWAIVMALGAGRLFSRFRGSKRQFLAATMLFMILGTPLFYAALPGLARGAGLNDASLGIPQIGIDVRDGLTYYINPNKRGDFKAYEFGRQTVANLAPHAVVIAEWYTDTDEYFVLRYFTAIEGLRPDVTIVSWPTQDPFTFDPQLASEVIEDSFPNRPVYLASLSDQFYAASKLMEKYCIVPENNLYRLYPGGFHDKENRCLKAITG